MLTFTALDLITNLSPDLNAEITPDGRVVVLQDGEVIVSVIDDETRYVGGVLTFEVETTGVFVICADGTDTQFEASEAVGDYDETGTLANYTTPADVAAKIALAITDAHS